MASSSLSTTLPVTLILAVVVMVVVVVPSVGHIEASMAPMPVSLTDPNSYVADPNIGAFRDDHRFVADD